jgi:ATP-dependent Lon protease
MEAEIDLFQVEKRIRGRVKKQMERSQREYYLNEQMKAIQKELGNTETGNETDDIEKENYRCQNASLKQKKNAT